MVSRKKNNRFTITKTISDECMTREQLKAAEELLARMVARAIWAELYPESLSDQDKNS